MTHLEWDSLSPLFPQTFAKPSLSLQFSSLDLDQTLFQPFPSEVIFQNFAPCEIYEVPLILRNNDKVCHANSLEAG